MSDLPEPMTPPDCDLRGLPFLPLDVVRLMESNLFALSTGEEFKAAVALWCRAWNQVPAASVPDDDRILAHLSGAGARWKKVRAMALHGWVKCSDGRLYHPVVAEKAIEAWALRVRQRERSLRGNAKRWGSQDDGARDATRDAGRDPHTPSPAASPRGSQGTGTEKEVRVPPFIPPSPPDAPPSASPKTRGFRLPENWQPNEELADFCRSLRLDPADQAARFRDYWTAQPGQKGRKVNWPATWRNWCRTAAEQRPRSGGTPEKPKFRNGFIGLLMEAAGDDPNTVDAIPERRELLQ